MTDIPNGAVLRIYLKESDKYGSKLLHEELVARALEAGLAGATVLRGAAGFGATATIHTTKILRLSSDLPIIVEIVDAEEKIEAFLPEIEPLIPSGAATVHRVRLVRFGDTNEPEI